VLKYGQFVCGAAVLCIGSVASAAEAPMTELAGRTVSLGLIRSSDRAPVSWPAGNSRLTTEQITYGPETNIAQRLASNGIVPDSGAFSLFYDLNPAISKADSIAAGDKIVIPKMSASGKLRSLLADQSHFVVLYLDPQLRQELANTVRQVAAAVSRFDSLAPDRFSKPVDRTVAVKQVDDVAAWFDDIRKMWQMRKGPPTSKETLTTLNDEAHAFLSMLQQLTDSARPIDAGDAQQVAAIHTDLEREIKRYDDVMSGETPDPEPIPCCRIEAAIIGVDPKDLAKVRVYYTLEGLFSPTRAPVRVYAFPGLGSGQSGPLRAKSYRVWVSPEGSPNNRLTNGALPVDLNPAEKLTKIQLRLAQQPPGN
jgi:hypothetical protein